MNKIAYIQVIEQWFSVRWPNESIKKVLELLILTTFMLCLCSFWSLTAFGHSILSLHGKEQHEHSSKILQKKIM